MHAWSFEIKTPVNSGAKSYSGISAFHAKPKTSSSDAPKAKGTGTAFVVDDAGFLLTCAHVVENASSIKVHLGGASYPAEVVATEGSLDMALLKIDGALLKTQGIKTLSLAQAETVELAQEVRTVGFPLSQVLGDSVKITRGTISGKLKREGRDLYQIDASINPGNSGGPVIDLRGNVVGMASEKIHGQAISNVGFCIPSQVLETFLRQQGIQSKAANTSEAADGPALAKTVTPSVALVEVEIGSGEAFELTDFSNLYGAMVDRNFLTPAIRTGGEAGVMTISADGRVLEMEGGLQSPFLFGPVATLSLVPLPKPWQTQWGGSREIKITFTEEDRSQDPFDRIMQQRYRRISPFAPPPQQRIVAVDAVETEEFKIVESKNDQLTIEKTWRMATQGAPKLEVSGKWSYQFDKKLGAVVEVKGTSSLQIAEKKISLIEIAMKPFSIETGSSEPGYVTPRTPTVENAPPPSEISEPLKKLADAQTSAADRAAALDALAKVKVHTRHRSQVLECLETEIARPEVEVAVAAIKAMTHWDAATRVEAVAKLLKHDDGRVREAVVEYLGDMQDGSATPALVEALQYTALRPAIYKALRSIGPTGEMGVIKMLSHQDAEVRSEGCRVLAEIGTNKCVDELRRIAQSADSASPIAKETLATLGQSVTAPTTTAPKESTPSDDDENPFAPKKKP